MFRRVVGLQSVELAESPWGAPRAKGAKAQGLRFERGVGKGIPVALHNQWFKFVDNNGKGFCAPDYLFVHGGALFVVECKLTDWNEVEEKFAALYRPVLQLAWGLDVRSITVAKNLSPHTRVDHVVTTWDEALCADSPVLHALRPLSPPKSEIKRPRLKTHCNILEDMRV